MKSYGIFNMNRVEFIFQGTYLHNELKDYILSLNGVDEVYIDNEENLIIKIIYNKNVISNNILYLELNLFLNYKTPYLYSFNKYSDSNLKVYEYKFNKEDDLIEYEYFYIIDKLFNSKGVEKIESDYDYSFMPETLLKIYYDDSVISLEEIKKVFYE